MQSIEWRPVPGFEGIYSVSNQGEVRRDAPAAGATAGRILRAGSGGWHRSYAYVALRKNGKAGSFAVHRLVTLAFLGEPGDGQEVRHLNGQPKDNRLENLRWGTKRENMADKLIHGTYRNGNTDKTHCVNGHEFTPENTRRSKLQRTCKTCARAADLRHKAKKGKGR